MKERPPRTEVSILNVRGSIRERQNKFLLIFVPLYRRFCPANFLIRDSCSRRARHKLDCFAWYDPRFVFHAQVALALLIARVASQRAPIRDRR